MGEMGRKAKKVVKDKKIVSPKRFVADIWHVLSYHSISKLPGMVWYGRRSAEMPVAVAKDSDDSDDSLRMLSVNGTDSTMLPLPPSRVSLQPILLICLGNCCCCYHHFKHGGWKSWAEDAVKVSADPAAVPVMCQAHRHRQWRPKPPLMKSVRNVPCDKRFLRGDNLSISDRIYLYARG